MSVTIRPYRRGGWEVDIRVVTPDGARDCGSASALRCRRDRPPCAGLRAANACCSSGSIIRRQTSTPRRRCPPYKSSRRDSSTATRGRIGRSRAGSQRRNVILRLYLVPAFGRQTARRDQERGRAAVEGAAGDQVAEDGEQHPRGAERAAEEGGRVGSDRADAVHGQAAAASPKGATAFHDFDEYERLVDGRTLDRSADDARSCCSAVRPGCGAAR